MSSPLGPLLRKLQSATIGKPKVAPDGVERKQLEAEFQARRQQLEDEMRQRSAELTQREDFIQRVTDTLPGMVAYWNYDGFCEFANAAYCAWFGRSREEMLGLHAREMLGDEEYTRGRPMIETVLAGQSHQIERTLTSQQGEVRHFFSHYVPNWRDGKVHGFFIMQADVTPIKAAELQSAAQQRGVDARRAVRAHDRREHAGPRHLLGPRSALPLCQPALLRLAGQASRRGDRQHLRASAGQGAAGQSAAAHRGRAGRRAAGVRARRARPRRPHPLHLGALCSRAARRRGDGLLRAGARDHRAERGTAPAGGAERIAGAGARCRRPGQSCQERVPRQHEPRDPHADEHGARHDAAVAARASQRAAGRRRGQDQRRHPALAVDHQRHPRPVEDRGRPAAARAGELPAVVRARPGALAGLGAGSGQGTGDRSSIPQTRRTG